jgi:digeranylgeranylglycerophospholipid reductase
VLERKASIGSVVRCGEYLASNGEIQEMFPRAYELEDLHRSVEGCVRREFDTFSVHSPKGRRYVVPFKGMTIDRPKFERNLAGAAAAEGAEILLDAYARSVKGHEVVTTKGPVRGTVVVAADGPASRISRAAGLPRPAQLYRAVTTFVEGDVPDEATLYFGRLSPGAYAWIFPKNGIANAGLGVWDKFGGNLSGFLKSWLRGMGLTWGPIRGKLVPATGPVSPTQRGNVLAVGDAAGHVIPTTGGGMQTSMMCAREAAKAINAHLTADAPLAEYEAASRRIVWERLRMGVRIKILADRVFWSDPLTAMAMRVLGTKGIGRVLRCQPLFRSPKGRTDFGILSSTVA